VVTDFWAMVFNPSATYRFLHVLVGAWLVGAFFVMSVSAFYILKNRHLEFAKRSFIIALLFAAIAAPTQGMIGSKQAEVMVKYQPAKLAAFEGQFHTGSNATFWIIGYPDSKTQTVKGVGIPGLLSILATGSAVGEVKGLDAFPAEDQPPVLIPF